MNKANHVLLYFNIFTSLIFAILILNGKIVFGHGLGDIYILSLYVFVFLLYIIISIKKRSYIIIASVLMIIASLFIIFKATFLRGPEYPWNNKIFVNN